MKLYNHKNVFANVFVNEFCFYMILASLFKRTQCLSTNVEKQLSLYYADLVRDHSGYDRKTGKWREAFSYVRQERMEDQYIPLIEEKLAGELVALGWNLEQDQAEVYIEPAMKVTQKKGRVEIIPHPYISGKTIRKTRRTTSTYGHIFRFVGLYHELDFQVKETRKQCEVFIRVRMPGGEEAAYRLSGNASLTAA